MTHLARPRGCMLYVDDEFAVRSSRLTLASMHTPAYVPAATAAAAHAPVPAVPIVSPAYAVTAPATPLHPRHARRSRPPGTLLPAPGVAAASIHTASDPTATVASPRHLRRYRRPPARVATFTTPLPADSTPPLSPPAPHSSRTTASTPVTPSVDHVSAADAHTADAPATDAPAGDVHATDAFAAGAPTASAPAHRNVTLVVTPGDTPEYSRPPLGGCQVRVSPQFAARLRASKRASKQLRKLEQVLSHDHSGSRWTTEDIFVD